MSGDLTVIIREENGNIHNRTCNTKLASLVLKDIRVQRKNFFYLQQEIIDNPRCKPCQLIPQSYGIIVVDFKENYFLDCNSYSAYNLIEGLRLHLELGSPWGSEISSKVIATIPKTRNVFHDEATMCFRLDGWVKENKVKAFLKNKNNYEPEVTLDQIIKWDNDGSLNDMIFELDWSPIKTLSYNFNFQKGYDLLREKLIELEFNITKKEKQIWDNFWK